MQRTEDAKRVSSNRALWLPPGPLSPSLGSRLLFGPPQARVSVAVARLPSLGSAGSQR